jgi:hypothetical protein
MRDRPPALSVGGMQNTAIEVHDLCKAYDGQPRCPLLGAQLQSLPDRMRVREGLRLADRRRSMLPRAAARYGMRHAQATLGWAADVRLILGTKWVALSELGYRAAGGW